VGKTLHYGEFKFDKSPAKPTTQGYKSGGKVGLWDNIHAKRERIEGGSGERMRKPGSKGAPTNQDFKAAASKMKEGGSADMSQDKAMIKKAMKQHDTQKHSGSESTKLALKKGGQAKMTGMKREPEAMVKKEVALLKKAGAPAKLIKHEEREGALLGLKKGGKPKKYQEGGSAEADNTSGSNHSFREVNGKYMHNNEEVSKADFDRRRAAVDAKIQRMRGPDTSKMSAKDRAKSAFDELDAEVAKKPYKKGGNVKKYADGGTAKGPMTEKERQQMRMQMAKEQEMDRKMRKAEKDAPTNQRMLDEAMNPLSMLKEAYDKVTDRSGRSATDNMQRYGMKKGGVPSYNRNPKIG
jgi:hypothetical protein